MCNGRVFREPPGLLTIQARVHSPSFTHLLIWMAPVQYLIYLCPLFVYLYDITVPYSTYLSIYLIVGQSVRLPLSQTVHLLGQPIWLNINVQYINWTVLISNICSSS